MNATRETGDATAEIEQQCKDRMASLGFLVRAATDAGDLIGSQPCRQRLAEYGIETTHLDDPAEVEEAATQVLSEYPLCVEATTVFEVVLGTGGPDDRLIFECSGDVEEGFEIDRVLYRYSWTGSAERVLSGEDREVAEEFARRTVPELAE